MTVEGILNAATKIFHRISKKQIETVGLMLPRLAENKKYAKAMEQRKNLKLSKKLEMILVNIAEK